MNAIKLTDLTKVYGHYTAVDRLNLTVNQGELFALLGVNGAGKSTTIKMLSCILSPTSGDGALLGSSIVTQPQLVKQKINISPQETAIAWNLSVLENLELIARIYGDDRHTARRKALSMLTQFGLERQAKARAKTLSGGMQRRLSIAMALITEPEILFLDEPTLGLDVISRRELWAAIEQLTGKVTIVLTTHNMEEAQALSDRIGIMAHGMLKAVGTVEELLALTDTTDFEDAFVRLAAEET